MAMCFAPHFTLIQAAYLHCLTLLAVIYWTMYCIRMPPLTWNSFVWIRSAMVQPYLSCLWRHFNHFKKNPIFKIEKPWFNYSKYHQLWTFYFHSIILCHEVNLHGIGALWWLTLSIHWPLGDVLGFQICFNFKHSFVMNVFSTEMNITLEWMPDDLGYRESALVQVMDWCHLLTSHYMNQWPSSSKLLRGTLSL